MGMAVYVVSDDSGGGDSYGCDGHVIHISLQFVDAQPLITHTDSSLKCGIRVSS